MQPISRPTPLVPAQQARLKRFGCSRCVDLHCHVLPGVDDGPQNAGEAVALCRMLVLDGMTDVVATPHQLGRWDGANLPNQIRAAVSELQSLLDAASIPLIIHAGGEVRLDERIPRLLSLDQVLTLADKKQYLLLELAPSMNVDPAFLASYLAKTGLKIVLAHSERYDALAADPQAAQVWAAQGVVLQVNAASLLGDSGQRAEAAAWQWLAQGWVSLIASDAHSVNSRRPRMSEAIEQIEARLGKDVAKRVCVENPERVLEGRELSA